jgi:phytoene/squalene synthetase
MRRLSSTLRECELPREPFVRLIEANRTDQRVARYETWEQLRGYCALSANPVGEIVLGVFGHATPARVALSDSICTALQLAEHCQDVAEDYAAGRVYLPREDLERFGCELELTGLNATHGSAPPAAAQPSPEAHRAAVERLRDVLAFEVARGRRLLDEGASLIDQLHGRERLAVAAFHAGGRAAFTAIERAGFNVLDGPPTASTPRRLQALLATLLKRPAATE